MLDHPHANSIQGNSYIETVTNTDTVCTIEQSNQQMEEAARIVNEAVPCFSGTTYFPQNKTEPTAVVSFWADSSFNIEPCEGSSPSPIARPMEEKAEQALSAHAFTCIPADSRVDISGGIGEDAQRIKKATYEICERNINYNLVFVVDRTGAVVDVHPRNEDNPSNRQIAACYKTALKEPLFPCLANMEICPSYL